MPHPFNAESRTLSKVQVAENMKRRTRLRDLMVQRIEQIHTRYGYSKLEEASLGFVIGQVEKLITAGHNSEQALAQIERNLRQKFPASSSNKQRQKTSSRNGSRKSRNGSAASHQKRAPSAQLTKSNLSQASRSSRVSRSSRRRKIANEIDLGEYQGSNLAAKRQMYDANQDVWAQLTFNDQQKYEKDEYDKRMRLKKNKIEFRKALDEQIKQKSRKKVFESKLNEKYSEFAEKQLETWKQEEQQALDKKKTKMLEEKRIRDKQALEDKHRKERAALAKQTSEFAEFQKLENEIAKEQDETFAKRLNQKKAIEKYLEFNKDAKAIKNRKIQEEQEEDVRLAKLYIERLDRLERERKEHLESIFAKQQRSVNMSNQLAQQHAKAQSEFESRAERQMAEIMRREQAVEDARKAKATRNNAKMRSNLAQQIKEKENIRRQELENLIREKQEVEQEVEIEERKESMKILRQKEINFQHRRELEQQIRDQNRRKYHQTGMTQQERKINQDLIKQLA